MDITITEALREVPTIAKKVSKKQRFVQDFLKPTCGSARRTRRTAAAPS